ncbi:hypothetical protein EXU48_10385 [Occultella glacieicola]|uniref:Secreted protein n=1 Tax=Occultella glacieicola TaxID=2518684 RepID=A0ABY2E2P1_9MICO|nr:hypothetical protein [Occultella glacieicola]TDE93878.1 hypothetical protein EXU48_10385 [Occultella glacieicola]
MVEPAVRGVAELVHRLGGGALVLGLALAGCSTETSAPAPLDSPYSSSAPGESLIETSRTSAAAPAQFRDREPLPDCGDVVFQQGEPEWPADVVTCLNTAGGADGPGAETAVQRPTVEGDPIITYYRVGAGIDGIEIYTDATQDLLGSRTWEYRTCTDSAEFDGAGPLCERG